MFDEITSRALEALVKGYGKRDYVLFWTRPQALEHGDISTSIALSLARELKVKPQEIAKTLLVSLSNAPEVAKAEIAGPGYVNVWLKPVGLLSALEETRGACTPAKVREGEGSVIVDYSQPNIAKPLGIHHILTTMIGQAIVNIHRHLGYSVVALNYIGDWGTQFGKLAVALKHWGNKSMQQHSIEELLALYVRFHQESEKDASLDDEAREAFLKLEKGDQEVRLFWKEVVDITLKGLQHLYERLHVSFDSYRGESYYEGKMDPVITEGKSKGIFVQGEKGALIAEFPPETQLPPAIVLKADQASIYLTRDIAAVKDRRETWNPQSILYVVDVAQSLHFRQLFEIVQRLGWGREGLEHIVFGRMSFADKAMSTRKGQFIRLEEALDEAVARAQEVISEHHDSIQTDDKGALAEMMGIGALVYGILSQNRKMDIVFDWKKVLSLEGNSAPYLQYTHARARSVLRKADVESVSLPKDAGPLTEHERELTGALLQFSNALEDARANRMPHTLANYLYGLCQSFNAFYNTEPILKAEEPVRTLRLALTSLTALVLRTGAEILTLRVPERM